MTMRPGSRTCFIAAQPAPWPRSAGAQPFINVHNYVYSEAGHCLYFHRNPVGRTSANLELNPQVCYNVVEMGRMYGGKNALEFGVEYRSVVIFGTARRVELEEAAHALRLLMEKYAPHLEFGVDYTAFKPQCPAMLRRFTEWISNSGRESATKWLLIIRGPTIT